MSDTIKRHTVLAYGLVAYATFGATFLYAIGFVGNLVVPKSIDSGAAGSPGGALLVNTLLLGLFGLQHTGMARQGFKRWWTRLVPTSIERSTYVLLTNVAFVLLFWLWRPMPATVWAVENGVARAALLALFWGGWAFVFAATCMINHFDLFGMRQVWLRWRGRPYDELGFRTVGLYKYVRHPIQLGFLIAFWATPDMTQGRLLFAVVTTAYILVAVRLFEERDLRKAFPADYPRYQRQVGMLLPTRRTR